jgi:hypothetical protein
MQTFWKNNVAPKGPYYAVIFISEKNENIDGYEEMQRTNHEHGSFIKWLFRV